MFLLPLPGGMGSGSCILGKVCKPMRCIESYSATYACQAGKYLSSDVLMQCWPKTHFLIPQGGLSMPSLMSLVYVSRQAAQQVGIVKSRVTYLMLLMGNVLCNL